MCQAVLKLWSGHEKLLTKRAITQKVDKPELRFMCSASRLMVFNVCVKFHENISSGFKVMERTRKLLTDTHTHTHTQRKDENIIPPWHTSYAGGIKMLSAAIFVWCFKC